VSSRAIWLIIETIKARLFALQPENKIFLTLTGKLVYVTTPEESKKSINQIIKVFDYTLIIKEFDSS